MILPVIILAIGLLVMLYPTISDTWNNMRSHTVISQYEKSVDTTSNEELDSQWTTAVEYNTMKTRNVIYDAFGSGSASFEREYSKLLNPLGNGVMGYIEIPKIKQRLPIYHGTGEEELKKGCGHLEGTSLPAGGKNTHCVVAAHRGLPSAKLFSDLDQMEIGDQFYLFILDRQLTYEVDQIETVLPEQTEYLEIEDGEDYVTLLTCTPYGVNSHRLLVRGHRATYKIEENDEAAAAVDDISVMVIMAVAALALIALIMLVIRKLRRYR